MEIVPTQDEHLLSQSVQLVPPTKSEPSGQVTKQPFLYRSLPPKQDVQDEGAPVFHDSQGLVQLVQTLATGVSVVEQLLTQVVPCKKGVEVEDRQLLQVEASSQVAQGDTQVWQVFESR